MHIIEEAASLSHNFRPGLSDGEVGVFVSSALRAMLPHSRDWLTLLRRLSLSSCNWPH